MKSIHLNYFEMPVTKIYEREKTFKKSALKESRFRFFFRLLDSSVNAAKKKTYFPTPDESNFKFVEVFQKKN